MKKLVLIVVVTVLALGTASYAYAQTQTPASGRVDTTTATTSTTPLTGAQGGDGLMGSSFGAGMMGAASGTLDGLLHDYIIQAFADATSLTVEEIEARLAAGETLSDIAVSLDYTLDEFRVLMDEVRLAALTAAVADGVITQEQADWMLSHMSQMWQGDASGKNWGAGGQMGKGQMMGNQGSTATGSASCTMNGSARGSGQGMRGTGAGTCTQIP